MPLKYILHPGEVVSRADGARHYVGALELARLYGVKVSECVSAQDRYIYRLSTDGLIHLYPRRDGDYTLPKEEPCTPELHASRPSPYPQPGSSRG